MRCQLARTVWARRPAGRSRIGRAQKSASETRQKSFKIKKKDKKNAYINMQTKSALIKYILRLFLS